jgi:hypothetical protein
LCNVREEIPWFSFVFLFYNGSAVCQLVQQVTKPHKFAEPDKDDNAAASHAAVGGKGQGSPLSCEPQPRAHDIHYPFPAALKIL